MSMLQMHRIYRTLLAISVWLFAASTMHAQSSPSFMAGKKSACEVLPREQVEAVVGALGSGAMGGTARAPMYCNYGSPRGGEVHILFTINNPPVVRSPRDTANEMGRRGTCSLVKGFGDKALLCNYIGTVESDLFVYANGKAIYNLRLYGVADTERAKADLQQLGRVANKTMEYYGAPTIGGGATSQVAANTVRDRRPADLITAQRAADSELNQRERALLDQAQAGDAGAEEAMAELYQYGTAAKSKGFHPDFAGAAFWYAEAAKHGSVDAMCRLAFMKNTGLGVRKDVPGAIELYTKAARSNSIPAMAALGHIYVQHGDAEGRVKAEPWLQRASDAGDIGATVDLATLHFQNGRAEYPLAIKLYQKAADAGNCVADYDLGAMYRNGYGSSTGGGSSRIWYQKAVDCPAGLPDALRQQAMAALRTPNPTGTQASARSDTLPVTSIENAVILGLGAIFVAALIADQNDTRTPEQKSKDHNQIEKDKAERCNRNAQIANQCRMSAGSFREANNCFQMPCL